MDSATKGMLIFSGMILAAVLLLPVAIEFAMWIARQP